VRHPVAHADYFSPRHYRLGVPQSWWDAVGGFADFHQTHSHGVKHHRLVTTCLVELPARRYSSLDVADSVQR